ncbi:MAG: Esterase [Actinomycetia bacterium]|nr:Esterase [Actinomycetes bacterium]
MAATPSGHGYWLTASDGGIFSFGDATYRGSTSKSDLQHPIAGMARTTNGRGYWFVETDGVTVHAFGNARVG